MVRRRIAPPRRAKPYLYSEEQIHQLLEAAKNVPATHSLQSWAYHCLLGLLPSQVCASVRHSIYGPQTSTGRKACARSGLPSSEDLD